MSDPKEQKSDEKITDDQVTSETEAEISEAADNPVAEVSNEAIDESAPEEPLQDDFTDRNPNWTEKDLPTQDA
ncbi:hypothetical protein DXZ20_06775 [Leptolyngbyaceae cyanobacterium CCMR0081]|uniref:Uncharacterized protein n=2 Tax=Adonisia TaxID=2950183 RepID=A0A6M0RGM3_9CYAN|nr:hypothetical protein [Adonisia turfae CCMR0081]